MVFRFLKKKYEKITLELESEEVKHFQNFIGSNNRFYVFSYKNIFFRGVPQEYEQFVKEFFSSELPAKLIELQLIPEIKISDLQFKDFNLVIEQKAILWNICPQEWTFSMLREAALCVLKINQISQKYGYETFDCHGFNVFFNGTCPQFIDVGSFVKKSSLGIWWALDEFIRCYLYPLKLWAQGQFYLAHQIVSDNYWKRFYPEDTFYRQGFEFLLERETDFDALIHSVLNIQKKKVTSPWGDYHHKYHDEKHALSNNSRFDKILKIVRELDVRVVHDMGGNAGIFTRLLLENTQVEKCLCSDMDENAIDLFFEISRKDNFLKDKASCALLNLLAPMEHYGVDYAFSRLKSEAIFLLAVLHHLLLRLQASLDVILEKLIQYTDKYIFIEFMPFSHINGYSRAISKEFDNYSEEWFNTKFQQYFKILKIERTELNRILYVGEKLTCLNQIALNNINPHTIEIVEDPVLLILQSEEDLDALSYLKTFAWKFLFIAIRKDPSFLLTIKIKKWLKKNADCYKADTIKIEFYSSVTQAIDNFFKQFEQGIIIENGIRPARTFFKYASQLIRRYHDQQDILQISGVNFCNNSFDSDSSYIFTRSFFGGVFATWRTRWDKFKQFNITSESLLNNDDRLTKYYSKEALQQWHYKWILFGVQNGYLSVQPCTNLVKFLRERSENINYLHTLSVIELDFPLKHPGTSKSNEIYNSLLNTDFLNPFLPFSQDKLAFTSVNVLLSADFKKIELYAKEKSQLKINIKNCGLQPLSSLPPFPVKISYHWINDLGDCHVFEGVRTELHSEQMIDLGGLKVPEYLFLLPEESRDYFVTIVAPDAPGAYLLKLTVLQEDCFWFDNFSKKNALKIDVLIK